MKIFIKEQLEKFGIRLNFVKNLWYLDSFVLLKKLNVNVSPIIFDVGACDGSSVAEFKKIFPLSTIYSFEPFPDSYNNLVKFAEQFTDVKYFELALAEKDGYKSFFVNKSKATNSLLAAKNTDSFIDEHIIQETSINVKTMMLDSFVEENKIDHIDILKIDVQGGELMVFEGSQKTLQRKIVKIIYTEIWFIEGYTGQPLFHDIASHLAKFGYFPYGIYNMHYRKDGHFLWGDAIFYIK